VILARLGIRSFNPKLKKAPERLEHLRTPEGEPIPPNTLAELQRDMARKQFVAEQIRQIEKARLEQLKEAPKTGPNLMVLVLMRVIGIGIETGSMRSACPGVLTRPRPEGDLAFAAPLRCSNGFRPARRHLIPCPIRVTLEGSREAAALYQGSQRGGGVL